MASKTLFILLLSAICIQFSTVTCAILKTPLTPGHVLKSEIDDLHYAIEQLHHEHERLEFNIGEEIFGTFNKRASNETIVNCLVEAAPKYAELIDKLQKGSKACIDKTALVIQEVVANISSAKNEINNQLDELKTVIPTCNDQNEGDSNGALACMEAKGKLIVSKIETAARNIEMAIRAGHDAVENGKKCLKENGKNIIEEFVPFVENLKKCIGD